MSFESDLLKFEALVTGRMKRVTFGIATEAHRSVTAGSELTGAPGQPVKSGNLRGSFKPVTTPDADGGYTISTNVVYAPAIEAGVGPHGPLTLRSGVGGFHSVEITETNADRIQIAVLARVVAGG